MSDKHHPPVCSLDCTVGSHCPDTTEMQSSRLIMHFIFEHLWTMLIISHNDLFAQESFNWDEASKKKSWIVNDTSKPLHSIWSWLIELLKSLSKYSSWKTPSSEFDNCKVSLARSSKPLQLRHASKGPVVQLKGSPWPSLSTSNCCDWPFLPCQKYVSKKNTASKQEVSRKSFTSSAIHSWGAQVLSQLETEFTSVTPRMGSKAWFFFAHWLRHEFIRFLCSPNHVSTHWHVTTVNTCNYCYSYTYVLGTGYSD